MLAPSIPARVEKSVTLEYHRTLWRHWIRTGSGLLRMQAAPGRWTRQQKSCLLLGCDREPEKPEKGTKRYLAGCHKSALYLRTRVDDRSAVCVAYVKIKLDVEEMTKNCTL